MINHRDEKFFHGFLPIWPLVLFGLAILFALIFSLGLICHWTGCQKARDPSPSSMIEPTLLVKNESQFMTQKSSDHSF